MGMMFGPIISMEECPCRGEEFAYKPIHVKGLLAHSLNEGYFCLMIHLMEVALVKIFCNNFTLSYELRMCYFLCISSSLWVSCILASFIVRKPIV